MLVEKANFYTLCALASPVLLEYNLVTLTLKKYLMYDRNRFYDN